MDIIRHPITPEKAKAWHWKSHQYFTKQAHNVVREYILHFTQEGDTVLDPFSGTGVTAIEALAAKRKAVMCDLNPLACFITRQTCRRIDTDPFKTTFERLEAIVKPRIQAWNAMPEEEIALVPVEYWYPRNAPMPKNADFQHVEELFTKRQLLAYARLLHEIMQIEEPEMRDMFRYVFSATMAKVNLTYMPSEKDGKQIGGGGAAIFGTYRYWKPPVIRELDVWENFATRFNYIYKGKQQWHKLTEGIDVNQNLTVIQVSAEQLSRRVASDSIDYIYTDPPYGGNIAYLDLSTMWNAWLGFETPPELKQAEIIEGGDLEKTQQDYETRFTRSLAEMSAVLKKDGWLSVVFAHKKLEFWNMIVDACETNGMELKGSVYQPTNNSSVHYKKNPANVLCSQRIATFRKTFQASRREQPDDLKAFILNEINQACLEERGAAIDVIYQRVLDQLLRNNTIHEAKKKGYLKLQPLLDDPLLFAFDPATELYHSKHEPEHTDNYEQQYFTNLNELTVYVKSLLQQKNALSLDEIQRELFEIYAEEHKFPVDRLSRDLADILREIASKNTRTGKWALRVGEQTALNFNIINATRLVKVTAKGSTHAAMIFRLVKIGQYLGYRSWIGKREQQSDSFQGEPFSLLSLKEFPLANLLPEQRDRIQQIDVIWFDQLALPRYAFEIEESTPITTGFERFAKLLDVRAELAKHLFIVAPKSRQRKIQSVFRHSIYIGHPLYFENKIGLIYREALIEFYDVHLNQSFDERALQAISVTIPI